MSISCRVCDEVFKTNVLLIRHRRYQSRKCEKHKIQNHCLSGSLISYLSQNSIVRDVECSRCVKTFFDRKHLSVHMRIHTKNTPYKCDYCSKTFILRLHLYYHLDSHRGDESNETKCVKCRSKLQEFLKKLNLDRSTISALRCWFCNKRRFSNVAQLILHLRITHRPQMSVCSDCGHMSITFQDIVAYLKIHSALIQKKGKQYHPADRNGGKNHQCESCGRTFAKINLLEIHLLSHISDPLFCCRNCQEVFRNGQLYMMHIKKCFQKKCLPSSAKFVADHFPAMSDDEAFDCPYCTLCFASPLQLKTHLPFHRDVKDSRSDTESADEICITKDQSETEMDPDQNHVRSLVCSNCKQVFKKNEDLMVHLKTGCPHHTYSCQICFKIFSWSSDLEIHVRNHHCIEALGRGLHERTESSSKLLNREGQFYKSFVNSVSEESLPSYGIGATKISSNMCNPGYFDCPKDPDYHEKGDNFKSQLEEHFLCDVCGEVFSGLVDLDDHMNQHNPQEVCEQIYPMANMNHSRQPNIYQSQPSWMMIRPPENPTPYFMSNNNRGDNNFSSGPDMNSYFTKIENMNPMSHRIGFPLVQQANNVTFPTFSSAYGIPFIPSINELKSLPYPESVSPGFPFHLQNSRGNFFPASNLDNRCSTPNLPYEDCRDNNLTSNNNNSKLNAFYSVPLHGNVSLANKQGKNSNLERDFSVFPIISEKRNPFYSQFTPPQNTENLGTVPQKTNPNISHSTSEYELNTSFVIERGNLVSDHSIKNRTCLNNNGTSFSVSFSDSKCPNFTSANQNDLTECSPPVPLIRTPNNVENQDVEYPSVNELLTLPNLSHGQHLPEMEPLNLCQTRNLQTGKFYNYSVDPDLKGFDPQQSPLNNLSMNMQTPYPVPPFWEASKSCFDFNLGGNQCLAGENESTIKYNSGFQIESMQSPLWVEPNYNTNLKLFQDPTSGRVNEKNVKIRTNTTYPEDNDGHIDSLHESRKNTRN